MTVKVEFKVTDPKALYNAHPHFVKLTPDNAKIRKALDLGFMIPGVELASAEPAQAEPAQPEPTANEDAKIAAAFAEKMREKQSGS